LVRKPPNGINCEKGGGNKDALAIESKRGHNNERGHGGTKEGPYWGICEGVDHQSKAGETKTAQNLGHGKTGSRALRRELRQGEQGNKNEFTGEFGWDRLSIFGKKKKKNEFHGTELVFGSVAGRRKKGKRGQN